MPLSFPVPCLRSGFDLRNFCKNSRRLRLKGTFQVLIIHARHFARFVLKVQIAKVLVYCFFALVQEGETRGFGAGADRLRDAEDAIHGGYGERDTNKEDHTSVSLRACSRKRSSSGLTADDTDFDSTIAGRLFQFRATKTTPPNPTARAQSGP